MQGARTAKGLATLCIFLLLAVLFFRTFVYSRLPISPDDPYGVSDIIGLLLGWALILSLVISAGVAVALGFKRPRFNRQAAAWLGLIVVLVAAVAGPLPTVVARLGAA